MSRKRRDPVEEYFTCTDRDRALFEAGIKLGSIFHQFIGVPLTLATARDLERTIERLTLAQPCVKRVRVRIDRSALRRETGPYGYASLSEEMLDALVETEYEGYVARCRLEYIKELGYTLMFVENVIEPPETLYKRSS